VKDIKSYLESGILEQYVLGDLSNEEMLEVEQNSMIYPEIKSEIIEIESALLNYALYNAIEPSKSLRDKVLYSIEKSNSKTGQLNSAPSKLGQFYKYAFAASFALLFISIILLINLNNKLTDSYNEIAILQSGNERFSSRVNFIDEELRDTRNALNFYQNQASYKLVTLKGSDKAPDASMLIAFNPEQEEVMIDLSSIKMPSNDEDHQYQLWAMVDGKPVDLGVFDSELDSTGMKKMKSVKNVQAFAVTLEIRGGSTNPNMDQMMAIGSI
jgi:anti-sigma-K factor RskA